MTNARNRKKKRLQANIICLLCAAKAIPQVSTEKINVEKEVKTDELPVYRVEFACPLCQFGTLWLVAGRTP